MEEGVCVRGWCEECWEVGGVEVKGGGIECREGG